MLILQSLGAIGKCFLNINLAAVQHRHSFFKHLSCCSGKITRGAWSWRPRPWRRSRTGSRSEISFLKILDGLQRCEKNLGRQIVRKTAISREKEIAFYIIRRHNSRKMFTKRYAKKFAIFLNFTMFSTVTKKALFLIIRLKC